MHVDAGGVEDVNDTERRGVEDVGIVAGVNYVDGSASVYDAGRDAGQDGRS